MYSLKIKTDTIKNDKLLFKSQLTWWRIAKETLFYYFKDEDETKPKSQKKVQMKSSFSSQLKSIRNFY